MTEYAPPSPTPDPGRINWPTVLTSAGVSALVAALILTVGVVGLSRGTTPPAVVVQGAAASTQDPDTPAVPNAATPPASTTSPIAEPAPSELPATAGGVTPAAPAAPVAAAETQDESAGAGAAGGGESSPEPSGPAEDHWNPATPLPVDYVVTAENPTVEELGGIITFLTATDASDEAKARNIESADALIVPTTVSRIGLFRAPRGSSSLSGPLQRDGDRITAHLTARSAGIPDVSTSVTFVRIGGNWRLSNSSLCSGVRAVGLPIYCNA